MKNIPDKIYLQIGFDPVVDDDFNDLDTEAVSWCQDRIFESDIEYSRAAPPEEAAQWREKAQKWDALKAKIAAFYEDEDFDADDDSGDGLISIGEIAAADLGFMY